MPEQASSVASEAAGSSGKLTFPGGLDRLLLRGDGVLHKTALAGLMTPEYDI